MIEYDQLMELNCSDQYLVAEYAQEKIENSLYVAETTLGSGATYNWHDAKWRSLRQNSGNLQDEMTLQVRVSVEGIFWLAKMTFVRHDVTYVPAKIS